MADDLQERLNRALQGAPPQAPSIKDRPEPGAVTNITPDWAKQGYNPVTQTIALPSNDERLTKALSGQKPVEPSEPERSASFNVGRRMMESPPKDFYGLKPEQQKQALSGLSGFGDTFTLGFQPWATAAMTKGASYLDPRESNRAQREKIQSMPMKDLVEMARGMSSEAQTQYPKTALAGQATGLAGSVLALPVVLPKAGAMASGAATGVVYGGLSGLSKDFNPIDALEEGVIGGVAGGTLGPIVEKTIGLFSKLLSKGFNIVDENGLLSPAAAKIAKEVGLSDMDIVRLGPSLGASFKKYGMRPEAVRMAQFEEFGITPTQGMVTKDPKSLMLEQKLSDTNSPYAKPTYESIRQQAGETASTITGQPLSTREAVDVAVQSAQEKALAARTAASQAYTDASEQGGFFPRESITNVGDIIIQGMARDPSKGYLVTSDAAQAAVQKLNQTLGAELPMRGPLVPGGQPITSVNQDFRAVESGRQALNTALTDAMKSGNSTNVRAVNEVIDQFDNHIENQIANGAFESEALSGPEVLNKWREARALWSDYKSKYGVQRTGEEAGNLLKQIIDQEKSSDDVGRMLFNFSTGSGDASMKVTAMKAINQMNRALGANSSEMQGIKRSFVSELMQPVDASPQGFAKTAARINDFVNGKGAGVANKFLTPQERGILNRFAKVMENAGSVPKDQLQQEVSRIAETARLVAPTVLSGSSYLIGALNPQLAIALAAAGYIPSAIRAYKSLPSVAKKIANDPFTGRTPLPTVPSVRTAVPLIGNEYPEMEETALNSVNEQADRAKNFIMPRASGGRTMSKDPTAKAMALIAMADRIKKEQGKDTSSLLNLDDTTVAKALAVANRGI